MLLSSPVANTTGFNNDSTMTTAKILVSIDLALIIYKNLKRLYNTRINIFILG